MEELKQLQEQLDMVAQSIAANNSIVPCTFS
jgi:hypothetical protein